MTDDNVLRLAHEVLAMNARDHQEEVLGTVITLRPDAIRSALRKGDFDFIPASTAPTDRIAVRDLVILLSESPRTRANNLPIFWTPDTPMSSPATNSNSPAH